jgi:hypothetical protein
MKLGKHIEAHQVGLIEEEHRPPVSR